jgi:hypothetical protein
MLGMTQESAHMNVGILFSVGRLTECFRPLHGVLPVNKKSIIPVRLWGAKQFCPPYGLDVFGISSAAGRSIQRWAFDANMLLE